MKTICVCTFYMLSIDVPHPCAISHKNNLCCNQTGGMTKNLELIMKVMRFASNNGQSHFSLTSVIDDSQSPLIYPMLPPNKVIKGSLASIKNLNSMIPVCFMKLSDDEKDYLRPDHCDLFQPVITDMGICSSFNPKPSLEMLNPSFFTKSFGNAFKDDFKPNQTLRYGERGGKSVKFFLVVNSKSPLQDHTRARFSMNEDIQPSNFYLSISTHDDYFQAKASSFAIRTGYRTTINVEPMEIVGSEDLRVVPINKRKCRFYDEVGDLVLFSNYSQSACNFEKDINIIYNICKCVPWYIPTTFDSEYAICDFYGMSCVEAVKKVLSPNEDCLPLCNQVQFTFNQVLEKIDADATCNKKSYWMTIPQNLHNTKDLPLVFMLQKIKEWNTKKINDTFDRKRAQDEFCKYMIDFNMAEVQVKFGTRKYIKTIMGLRVSFTDKLGVFGKKNICNF